MRPAPLSYHGDPALKATSLARVRAHRRADEIVQGRGWDGSHGCCIGCLAHAYPAHETLARDLAVPEVLLHLADAIHEGLPGEEAKAWPERFVDAIPVGVDLSTIRWRLCAWLLTDEAVNPGIVHETVRDAVTAVAGLCLRASRGDRPTDDEWSTAASASAAAAETAPAPRVALAAEAAYSAISSVANAAIDAAPDAGAWRRIADRLVDLLEEADRAA